MQHLYPILLTLLLCCQTAFGQQNEENDLRHLYVTITPTTWIDGFSGLALRGGLEYEVKPNLAICLDAAHYLFRQPEWTIRDSIKGYFLKAMVKFYLDDDDPHAKKPFERQYWALQYTFKNHSFAYHDSFSINHGPAFDKSYFIDAKVHCLTFVYGGALLIYHRLLVDYYVGGGVRFKFATSTLTDSEKNGLLHGEGHGDLIGDFGRATGNFVQPDVCLGVKIGLRLH